MERFFSYVAALSLTAKLVDSMLGLVLIRSVFSLLERTLLPHFDDGDLRHRVRKRLRAAAYISILIFLAILFADHLKRAGFVLGLFGAGLVVALQDVIASSAGFMAIEFSNLYRVGDRIQVNDIKGDVIDISVLRTTLMETGNWVSGDLYNGRIVSVSNATVLKGPVFNYSRGFRFVWDEIKIRLTSESDHQFARKMLVRVAGETVSDYVVEAQGLWKRVADNYRTENPFLQPTVTLEFKDGSLEFSVSYVVDYTKRTILKDRLFTKIVDEVMNSNGRLAWAGVSTTVVLQTATADMLARA